MYLVPLSALFYSLVPSAPNLINNRIRIVPVIIAKSGNSNVLLSRNASNGFSGLTLSFRPSAIISYLESSTTYDLPRYEIGFCEYILGGQITQRLQLELWPLFLHLQNRMCLLRAANFSFLDTS